MKKILPSAFIVALFGLLMVVQMLIHGEKLTATKINGQDEKFAVYETALTKLTGKSVNGVEFDFSKNTNGKVIVLNFWASWCKPCIKEFSSLNRLKDKFQDKILIVGINNDETDPDKIVKKMTTEYSLQFESIVDKEGDIAANFAITQIPASLAYYNGKIIHYSNTEFDFMNEDFVRLLESKIKE